MQLNLIKQFIFIHIKLYLLFFRSDFAWIIYLKNYDKLAKAIMFICIYEMNDDFKKRYKSN